MSRRAARELREREEAAAEQANQLRPRKSIAKPPRKAAKQARRAAASKPRATRRPSTRPEPVMPTMKRPQFAGRVMLAKLMSFSAMVGVAGMLVATSIPANAFIPSAPEEASMQKLQVASADIEVQSLGVEDVPEAAKTQARDNYSVVSLTEQLRSKYDTANFTFTNNPNGTIQWPFATGVPISSGFGNRVGCSYCSSNHMGVDFIPGLGAPIQAIADGVVREVSAGGGTYGVNVVVDHEINGEKVTSFYAHMMWGSLAVAAGQAVTVGQHLGDVGSTGASTGPHLHLEIHLDEKPVDPFVWLKANAN
ncbi:MAG: M23 family metallopeptidase [Homoserinimonas sp.]